MKFRVVALQAGTDHSKDGNPGLDANIALFERMAEEAAAKRPDLIVFPGYAITGWSYPLSNVMNGVAESIPGDGPWYQRYVALARKIGCPILGWLVDRDGGRYYNASFLLSAQGEFLGKYRKIHANLGIILGHPKIQAGAGLPHVGPIPLWVILLCATIRRCSSRAI